MKKLNKKQVIQLIEKHGKAGIALIHKTSLTFLLAEGYTAEGDYLVRTDKDDCIHACDICGRSEIGPVTDNPSAELLQMDYEEKEGLYICADCKEESELLRFDYYGAGGLYMGEDCKEKEVNDVEQIPLFSEPMPDLRQFTPAAVSLVKKIYDRRMSMREFAQFYDSALREYISDVFDVVRIDRLVRKRWGDTGSRIINHLITGKEHYEEQICLK